ncbi:hypothetical protein GPZ77_14775 [Streptomyces sp. QHH-9511]|uniref:hypothetical protein n=1 Tax=Streptomyces sp. QHH-9511 TaxID=2684468 RepID=UPI00131706E8|nr:hypothetical protein [Streptomyces sp. QHH-9511]QGZ49470.1 hypothetical protein GPZ77_14775 [Streptomyces sp. QHH-9511]
MGDIDSNEPVIKPTNLHATGGGEEITTKNLHATSEPAVDAITEKITTQNLHATGTPVNADASTDNLHATSEPAK